MTGTGGTRTLGIGREETEGWAAMVTIGVLLTILGIAALLMSAATGVFTVVLMGVALIVAGALELVQAYRRRDHRVLLLLGGIFSIVAGGLILARPGAGLAGVSLLLAMFFIANGLFRSIGAAIDRYPGWGWDLGYGLLALALGLYVVGSWPWSSVWLLGTIIGAEIMARGLLLVALGFEVRRLLRTDVSHRSPQPT